MFGDPYANGPEYESLTERLLRKFKGDPYANGPEYESLTERLLRKFKREGSSEKKVILTTSGPVRDTLERNISIEIGLAAAKLGIPYDEAIERFGQSSAHFSKTENGL